MRVYRAPMSIGRPMRRCGLRDAICAEVARMLPHTRPVHGGPS